LRFARVSPLQQFSTLPGHQREFWFIHRSAPVDLRFRATVPGTVYLIQRNPPNKQKKRKRMPNHALKNGPGQRVRARCKRQAAAGALSGSL
jgi:hypothetical protein